jgi:DNA-binding CsgD family transcriptional regulator
MSVSERNLLREAFKNHCLDSPTPDYERYIQSIEHALQLPTQNQAVYMVCDNQNYQIRYATDSTALFGFRISNPTDLARYHALVAPDHRDYNHQADSWHLALNERVPFASRVNIQAVHCGIKFNRADGRTGRLLAISHFVDPDANNNYRTVLVILYDVAHLYKGDHYWLRASMGPANERVFHYLSSQQRTLEQDILSVREKEVLRWLNKGLDSKEIGLQLGITGETVMEHRRNMLARTGARDTTALLQLAKWSSLL